MATYLGKYALRLLLSSLAAYFLRLALHGYISSISIIGRVLDVVESMLELAVVPICKPKIVISALRDVVGDFGWH